MIMFFDTETSNLPAKGQYNNPSHPEAPHIIEWAWLRAEDDGTVVDGSRYLIKPDGFTISPGAQAIHGISQEKAMEEGIELHAAMDLFKTALTECHTLVAHNINFDLLVVKAECLRLFGKLPNFDRLALICTMHMMTNVCKLRNEKIPYLFKWPKLNEAYMHLFNEPVRGAHGALADVEHCYRIYFYQQHGRNLPLPSSAE